MFPFVSGVTTSDSAELRISKKRKSRKSRSRSSNSNLNTASTSEEEHEDSSDEEQVSQIENPAEEAKHPSPVQSINVNSKETAKVNGVVDVSIVSIANEQCNKQNPAALVQEDASIIDNSIACETQCYSEATHVPELCNESELNAQATMVDAHHANSTEGNTKL